MEEKTLLQLVPKDKDLSFLAPEFMKFQKEFFPIFNLEMILEEDALKFKEAADFVKNEFRNLVKNLVVCFNNVLHPRVCKVQIDNQ